MTLPRKWTTERPGMYFPVFFLSFILGAWIPRDLSGQGEGLDGSCALAVSLGGTSTARTTPADALQNQAGLGAMEERTISLHHTRPFLLEELGVTMVTVQAPSGKGGIGAAFSSVGLKGFRYYSLWTSVGLALSPGIQAGMGLHIWWWSMGGILFRDPGISCALGIRFRINDRMVAGAHLRHPLEWNPAPYGSRRNGMSTSMGISYEPVKGLDWYGEIRMDIQKRIIACQGIMYRISSTFALMAGFQSNPFSAGGGIALSHTALDLVLSFRYFYDTGIQPASSISYGW